MRAVSILFAVFILAGCSTSSQTETGYEPRKLGLSDGQRRALYAPKYSPEAAAAQAEREAEIKSRKPGLFN